MISVVPMLAILTTAAELRQAVWSGVHEGERFSIECIVTAAMDKGNPDHSAYAIMDESGATYMNVHLGRTRRVATAVNGSSGQ